MTAYATPFDGDALSELVDAIARRVVELLDERSAGTTPGRLVDVAALAEILDVSADTVYRHQIALGVVKIGDGPKPALRFDVAKATSAWNARCAGAPSQEPATTADTGRKAGRPRRATGASVDLLPIRGRVAA